MHFRQSRIFLLERLRRQTGPNRSSTLLAATLSTEGVPLRSILAIDTTSDAPYTDIKYGDI